MKKNYEYYKDVIKTIERKYNYFSRMYTIFKLNYFKKKKVFYYKILNLYYNYLLKDNDAIKDITDKVT